MVCKFLADFESPSSHLIDDEVNLRFALLAHLIVDTQLVNLLCQSRVFGFRFVVVLKYFKRLGQLPVCCSGIDIVNVFFIVVLEL